jgi:hypothetical protein
MPRQKPPGWPDHMLAKPLKGGKFGYYWNAPPWARKAGYPITSEALGTDYAEAKRRCDDLLNVQLAAFRRRHESPAEDQRGSVGTFDWMAGLAKSSPKWPKRAGTRKSYDAALHLVSSYALKDGRTFGQLALKSITPDAADRLYDKLKVKADGRERAPRQSVREDGALLQGHGHAAGVLRGVDGDRRGGRLCRRALNPPPRWSHSFGCSAKRTSLPA